MRRSDGISPGEIRERRFAAIVISPGPGRPERAGISEEVVRSLGGSVPILGVCLGHQALASVAGCRIVRAPEPVHGRTSGIHHDGGTIFRGMPDPFEATRYHSLVVERSSIPPSLRISAWTRDGIVMGLRGAAPGAAPLEGVQFHPESILTRDGTKLLSNFLRVADAWAEAAGRD